MCRCTCRYVIRTGPVSPRSDVCNPVEAQIEAEVVSSEVSNRGRRSLLCHLTDGTGVLTLRFIHFSPGQQQLLCQTGARLLSVSARCAKVMPV